MATWTNYDLEQPNAEPAQQSYSEPGFYQGQTSGNLNKQYVESDNVTRAKAYLDSQLQKNNTNQQYQSNYQNRINDLYNALQQQQTADITGLQSQTNKDYQQSAMKAANDTARVMNNLSGGYNNPSVKAVADQMYNQAMLNRDDALPGLLNLGAQQAADKRADYYNQLQALQNQDNTEYGRYRDTVADRQAEIQRAQDFYLNQSNFDRSNFENDRSFNQSVYENEIENAYNAYNDYQSRKQNQVNQDNSMNADTWQQQWNNYYNSLKASAADKNAAWEEDYNNAKIWEKRESERQAAEQAAAKAAAQAAASAKSSSGSSSESNSEDKDVTSVDYSKVANDSIVDEVIRKAKGNLTMMSQAEFNRRKGSKSAYNGFSDYTDYLDAKLDKFKGSNGMKLTDDQILYIYDQLT